MSSSSPSAASSARCYVPRSVIVAVVAALASCTDAATVMTRMKETSMFRSKGVVDVDGNAAASTMKDNSETYNFNAQNYTNVANITDAEDEDATSGAVGDEEALSAVWYLAAFGGLVLFFFVVTCSELFFGNPIYTRRPVELPHAGYLRRHVYGIRNHGQHNYKPETPPPPYHLFAPPSYDDTVKGGFGQVQQQYHHRAPVATGKKLADVYVVPVHAATTTTASANNCSTTCATCTTNAAAVAVAVADAKLLAAVLPQTKFK
ncbi:uncharacterized protein LOC113556979 isoform X1 [Rhopalosiphum maidis]|uniref:uncharacterized protein LOC113556979 isoform X1 n=2 Tax=Rhopalosiphum maidis TaxID=43146 RepID=UPI000EFF9D07|nr:uncharacterized protein LOC113556979 isoform X1 [Rhopalosiphum maidis]